MRLLHYLAQRRRIANEKRVRSSALFLDLQDRCDRQKKTINDLLEWRGAYREIVNRFELRSELPKHMLQKIEYEVISASQVRCPDIFYESFRSSKEPPDAHAKACRGLLSLTVLEWVYFEVLEWVFSDRGVRIATLVFEGIICGLASAAIWSFLG